MIKAGDKVILDGVEYVIKEIKGNDVLLVKRDNALNIVFVNEKTLYAKLYEQQKQRADELEKLWSELVTFVKECDVVISKESENYPFMNDYEQAVIQGKENQIDNIIEKIEQLEMENNNA